LIEQIRRDKATLGERYNPANLVIFGWTHFAVYKCSTNALFSLFTAYCAMCVSQALYLVYIGIFVKGENSYHNHRVLLLILRPQHATKRKHRSDSVLHVYMPGKIHCLHVFYIYGLYAIRPVHDFYFVI
jgi:hypothetical protein